MILQRCRIILHRRENGHARIPAGSAVEAFRTAKNGATVIDSGPSGKPLIQLLMNTQPFGFLKQIVAAADRLQRIDTRASELHSPPTPEFRSVISEWTNQYCLLEK